MDTIDNFNTVDVNKKQFKTIYLESIKKRVKQKYPNAKIKYNNDYLNELVDIAYKAAGNSESNAIKNNIKELFETRKDIKKITYTDITNELKKKMGVSDKYINTNDKKIKEIANTIRKKAIKK